MSHRKRNRHGNSCRGNETRDLRMDGRARKPSMTACLVCDMGCQGVTLWRVLRLAFLTTKLSLANKSQSKKKKSTETCNFIQSAPNLTLRSRHSLSGLLSPRFLHLSLFGWGAPQQVVLLPITSVLLLTPRESWLRLVEIGVTSPLTGSPD